MIFRRPKATPPCGLPIRWSLGATSQSAFYLCSIVGLFFMGVTIYTWGVDLNRPLPPPPFSNIPAPQNSFHSPTDARLLAADLNDSFLCYWGWLRRIGVCVSKSGKICLRIFFLPCLLMNKCSRKKIERLGKCLG